MSPTRANVPFLGGMLVPDLWIMLPVTTLRTAQHRLHFRWPGGVPAGTDLYDQTWLLDVGGPMGFVASNGLRERSR